MPPNHGLTHLKEYDIKDSNVELIGTDIDHRVKYNSALTEPAWNDGHVGKVAGLYIWRIEDFEVVVWPRERAGQFYDGDSYIVLHSYKVGEKEGQEKLVHEIFFWLGSKTSQDEAGTAAYKTVELDEYLGGVATQHRETQEQPSEDFLELFPRLRILSGGIKSGFKHVEEEAPKDVTTLLRIFKHPAGRGIVVVEVEPTYHSLDEEDVFVLDKGEKIWVWQGKKCSPMEKAKAAQVVNDMTLAKHIDVEVLAQTDSRSKVFINLLGGEGITQTEFKAARTISSSPSTAKPRPRKLFRLSDSSGQLSFDLVKDSQPVNKDDFDGNDIFLLDVGKEIWVWRGLGASRGERASWLNVAQSYLRRLQEQSGSSDANATPFAAVVEGNESPAFLRAIQV
ncbi:gelsolin [Drepanopeziza brunnea f. sp. 'multigermtubi' MB_m1]|uniref:Gelsolin n=1 Tax=Marssonina brunnea f. sp. multigermtubi (strain MB_m1) TaxID=1072389 RepID=K1WVD6_MARBU|nr:gelsolin [Drepanopeziza brunnea f. sp. 'multigermtubi' MB_m1]EKD12613.1 gelsolin [Drepanopeziza brunnea f. sp. 'multigermtubi' MB_m1]